MSYAAVLFVSVLCSYAMTLLSQPPDVETELRAVMSQARRAQVEGDRPTMERLMADDYVQTDISGHVQDKAMWFTEYFDPLAKLIKAGEFRWEIYERKDVQFRIHGESAIVIGALELKGSGAKFVAATHAWVADPNATFSGTLRFTHVYVKQNGKWVLAALHNAGPFPQSP